MTINIWPGESGRHITCCSSSTLRPIPTRHGRPHDARRDSKLADGGGRARRLGLAPELSRCAQALRPHRCRERRAQPGIDGRNLESSAGDFPPPWRGTRCLWELTDGAGGGTTIRSSHRDWDEANPMVGRVTPEWGRILDHLARYVETGTPDPRTPAGAYEDQWRPYSANFPTPRRLCNSSSLVRISSAYILWRSER